METRSNEDLARAMSGDVDVGGDVAAAAAASARA